MNEDLLYQHYVEIGYNQGYRVCPKIKSYTLSESWLGGDGNQYSSVSTHHFDTYGGCILTESAGTAVNYHSITQYLYHYDENNRPVRIDTFSSIPATGDYYSESQLFRNNELGLCVFQAQVKEMLMGKGAPQIVTSSNYDKYWEYSYDEYGRCIYTYYNDKSVKKSESKTTIDYDVVDTDGNLIHHRIRSWDHVYDINRLAQAATNGEYAAYVYAQTDGKLMMTFDYRLYADKIHYWRCINTLEGTSVSQNIESNIPGGIYSIDRVYKDENGIEITAEEYFKRYGHPEDKAVPSNALALPTTWKEAGKYGRTYTYSFELYE